MALFEFFSKAKEKAEALQKKAEALTAQIEKDPIAALAGIAKPNIKQAKPNKPNKPNSTAKKIISMFYSDYPEIPYISNDRNNVWIDRALSMPKSVYLFSQYSI